MKKIFYTLLLLVPISFLAQTTIKGKVIDDTKYPLPGASIIVKGSTKGEVTDFDGNFSIKIDKTPATLVVSYLGYKTKEVVVNNQTTLTIQLEQDSEQLEEIVIIGYGSSTKKDLTGSLTEIKEKENVASQYNSVGSLLQGRSSGLQVNSNIGTPGAPVSVRIRGANSLRGNNEPLYVVDGVIINSAGEDVLDATSDANETQSTQNGLTGINPRDIESMVVLKDASATAIYGSRGANGVILITTKKGKQGKAVINTFVQSSISQATKKINVLDAVGYAQYRNVNAIQQNNPPNYAIEGNKVFRLDNAGNKLDELTQVNWQDEIFRNTFSTQAGLNISGANDKSNYYISGQFNDTQGLIPRTFLTSSNLQLNYTSDLNDKLNLQTRVGVYLGRGNLNQGASISGGSRSFTRQLISYNPLLDGEIEDDLELFNPYKFIENVEEKIDEKRINASIRLTYDITSNLKYQMRAGSNYRAKERSRWYGADTQKGSFTNGYLALSNQEKISYTFDNLLIFNKRFDNKHRLNATVGISYDGNNSNNNIFEVGDFPISNLRADSPQLGELILTPYSSLDFQENIFSYLARATYTIKNKYAINASFRADKSSKFQGSNQIGYFPAASLAWTASNEKFLRNIDAVNNLKVRVSWGQSGNQAINPYQTFKNYEPSYYSDTSNSTVLGIVPFNIQNKNLTWETTTQTNVGIDFGLWNNKLTGSVDAYLKETSDLLINSSIATSTGFQNYLKNQGGLENRGIDISLNSTLVNKEDFIFNIGGNISFIRNKITDLAALPPSDIYIDGQLENRSFYLGNNVSTGNNFKAPANVFIEGEQVGLFWGYKTNGIYSSNADALAGPTFNGTANQAGDVIFVDVNGDGNINDADKTNIGNPNPDFTFGLNADITYKQFSLSLLMNGVIGNEILNGNLLVESNAVGTGNNIRPAAFYDAWSPNNLDGAFPRVGSITASNVPNDRLIEDGSYLRLNNITLGYDFEMPENSLISSFKLFLSGNNLLTITNYSGYDPELTSFLYDGTILGVDWVGTPNVSSFVVGANIKF
mgnify:CR=1 FL=1